MKKMIFTVILAFAISMVSCGGNSNSQGDDSVEMDSVDTTNPDDQGLHQGAGNDTLFKSKSENADTTKMNQDGTKEDKIGE
jgi:hypothetical protein